jgi:sugar phosphate isomerase/epimerase
MDWSYQLYSSRDTKPWPEVLSNLAKVGYKRVEGFGGVYADAKAFRAELNKNGLKMPTGHFSIDALEKDLANTLATAKALGVKLVACPHIAADARPADAKGWQAFGKRLGKIGKKVSDAGFQFAWHNHDFEFALLPDGAAPMRHILDAAPEIGWEMDVAWVIRGGNDPAAWIKAYGSRIVAAHVKDIAPAGQNADEDGWADVGHGTVDWKGLYALLKKHAKAKYFVMEHDKPADAARFAKRSIASANKF